MKNQLLPILIFLLLTNACSKPEPTTIILVRHAEKDITVGKDPHLTARGHARAGELTRVLGDMKITAIYSTPYHRTKETVTPIAAITGLRIMEYTKFDKVTLKEMLRDNSGGTILISGHSNTIPVFLNILGDTEEYQQLEDWEYDKLFITQLRSPQPAKIMTLKYGKPSILADQ